MLSFDVEAKSRISNFNYDFLRMHLMRLLYSFILLLSCSARSSRFALLSALLNATSNFVRSLVIYLRISCFVHSRTKIICMRVGTYVYLDNNSVCVCVCVWCVCVFIYFGSVSHFNLCDFLSFASYSL